MYICNDVDCNTVWEYLKTLSLSNTFVLRHVPRLKERQKKHFGATGGSVWQIEEEDDMQRGFIQQSECHYMWTSCTASWARDHFLLVTQAKVSAVGQDWPRLWPLLMLSLHLLTLPHFSFSLLCEWKWCCGKKVAENSLQIIITVILLSLQICLILVWCIIYLFIYLCRFVCLYRQVKLMKLIFFQLVSTSFKISLFASLLGVRWQAWYPSIVCLFTMKQQPAAG